MNGSASLAVTVARVPAHELREVVQAAIKDLPGVTGEVVWNPSGEPLRVRTDPFNMTVTIYAEVTLDGPADAVIHALAQVRPWLALQAANLTTEGAAP